MLFSLRTYQSLSLGRLLLLNFVLNNFLLLGVRTEVVVLVKLEKE